MKKLFVLFIFYFSYYSIYAQTYHNEWINHDNTYFRVKVGKDGIYRIPNSVLTNSGLQNLDASGFKLYAKGKEVPIYISTNGVLNDGDYIEFYGKKNDGDFDTQLFQQADWQLTKELSLFNDTISYYLMWDNGAGTRFNEVTNDVSNPPAKESSFMHTVSKFYSNQHILGKSFKVAGVDQQYADFDEGEGFGSVQINNFSTLPPLNLSTPAKYDVVSTAKATLETKVVGRTNDVVINPDHRLIVKVNGSSYIDELFEGQSTQTFEQEVFLSDVNEVTTINFEVGEIPSASIDNQNIVYAKLTYPRHFDFTGASKFNFTLSSNEFTYLEITNFDGGDFPVLYDFTNNIRLIPELDNDTYKVVLPEGANTTQERVLYLVNEAQPANITTVNNLKAIDFIDYDLLVNNNVPSQGKYIIISHPSLEQGAVNYVDEYVNYRSSEAGGNYSVVKVNVEDLYDQFAWGIPKHSLAIQNFVNFAVDRWLDKPNYLFLLGKSVNYTSTRYNPFNYPKCLVPTFGAKASDQMLASRSSVEDYYPQLAVGRVSATNVAEVKAYLEKVVDYESNKGCSREDRTWTKEIAHVFSGFIEQQTEEYTGYLNNYKATVTDSSFGGCVNTYGQTGIGVIVDQPEFTEKMNEGFGLMTFVGHSSTGDTPWAFDFSSDPTDYTNYGRYPFMLAGSCFLGDIHNPNTSTTEDYVLIEDRGAIGYVASVSFGIPIFLDAIYDTMYYHFTHDMYGKPMGQIIQQSLQDTYVSPASNDITTTIFRGTKVSLQEFTLQGDPAVALAGSATKPEYIIENSGNYQDISVWADGEELPQPVTVDGVEQIEFRVAVSNMGKDTKENIVIRIDRTLPNNTTEVAAQQEFAAPACIDTFSLFVDVNAGTAAGGNVFTVVVDADNEVSEDCEDNNTASIPVDILTVACADVTPPTITNLLSSYCMGDTPVQLSADLTGGTFTIDNVPNTVFDPANLAIGTHDVQYTYTDPASGCEFSPTLVVEVLETPSAAFEVSSNIACLNEPIIVSITDFDANNVNNIDFDGGMATIVTSNTYSVVWNTGGSKTITFEVSNNSCSAMTNLNINLQEPLIAPIVSCQLSTDTSVTFSWTEVPGVDNYQILVDGILENVTLPSSANEYTFITTETVGIEVIAVDNGICENITSLIQVCEPGCEAINVEVRDANGTALQSTICLGDNPGRLAGVPGGGTFFLNGIEVDSVSIPNLAIGNYTIAYEVQIIDCIYASPEYEIEIAQSPNTDILGFDYFCQGSTLELEASGNHDFYEWSTGETTKSIVVDAVGEYEVIVTNGTGCTARDNITVYEAPEPNLEIAANGPTVLCNNEPITLVVLGCEAGSVLWLNSGSTDPTQVVIDPGTYSATCTDTLLCEWTVSIQVNQDDIVAPIILVNGTETTEICTGGTSILDAGEGYETYSWSTGETTQTIEVTEEGDYEVVVSSPAGCEINQSLTLEATLAVEQPTISATEEAICDGTPVTLDAGEGYVNYEWSDGQIGQIITVTSPADYTVIVEADNGCTTAANITIAPLSGNPIASFALTDTSTLCSGTGVSFVNNSENAATYTWTFTNDSSGVSFSVNDESPIINFPDAGTYTVNLVATSDCDNSNNEITEAAFVTVGKGGPTAEIIIDNADRTICPGDAVELEASAVGATNFEWLENGNSISTSAVITVTPNEETIYTLIATDELGCAAADTALIKMEELCDKLPNVITPNNDGFNDTWFIPEAQSNNEVSVQIFNRWGQRIFTVDGYDNSTGWDGTNDNGDEVAHGTYYFIIDLGTTDSKPLKGHITVIR